MYSPGYSRKKKKNKTCPICNDQFFCSFHHIRTELRTGGASADPGSAKDGAGRDAAGDSRSDIVVIPGRSP